MLAENYVIYTNVPFAPLSTMYPSDPYMMSSCWHMSSVHFASSSVISSISFMRFWGLQLVRDNFKNRIQIFPLLCYYSTDVRIEVTKSQIISSKYFFSLSCLKTHVSRRCTRKKTWRWKKKNPQKNWQIICCLLS